MVREETLATGHDQISQLTPAGLILNAFALVGGRNEQQTLYLDTDRP